MEFDDKMRLSLIKTDAADEDVARAAWVSNLGADARTKDAGRIKGLINFLYNNRHMSPFEHGSFTFFVDVPIFVAREFMRHRTFSYNEISARYTALEPRFYVPKPERPTKQSGKIGGYNFEFHLGHHGVVDVAARVAYQAAWDAYQNQRQAGIANEVARNTLPTGIYTQFYATCNPRNLMQFLTLRNSPHALYEIRDVADQMEEHLEHIMPLTYEAFSLGRRWERVLEDAKSLYTIEQAETLIYAARQLREVDLETE